MSTLVYHIGRDESDQWGFVALFWPRDIDCTFRLVEVATYIDDVEQYQRAGSTTFGDFTPDLDQAEEVVRGVIGADQMVHLSWGLGGSVRGGADDLERMMGAVLATAQKARELVGGGE